MTRALPVGITLDEDTGDFIGTVSHLETTAGLGLSNILTWTYEADGTTYRQTNGFLFVRNINRPPTIAGIPAADDRTINEGQALTFTLIPEDLDTNDDPGMFIRRSVLPAGATFVVADGTFSWTPTSVQSGAYSLDVTYRDFARDEARADIPITVTDVPLVGSSTVGEGDTGVDIDLDVIGDSLTCTSSSSIPSGLTLNADPCTITGDVNLNAVTDGSASQDFIIAYTITDGRFGLSDTGTYTLTVNAVLGAVTVALDADIADDDVVNIAEKAAGFAISGTVEAGAMVEVTLGSSSTVRPATVDGTTWMVAIPADNSEITGTGVAVTATAMLAGRTTGTVTRTITVDLTPPTATYTAPDTLTVGTAITTIMPGGASPDVAGYAVQGGTPLPPGLTLTPNSGAISGTPTMASMATAAVTIRLTDTAGNPTDVPITFPAVALGSQTLTGFAYSSPTAAVDLAAPTVTAPTGAVAGSSLSYASGDTNICTVESSTGALTLVAAGACVITVTASATPNYLAATDTFTITVAPPAATLTGTLTEASLFASTAPTVTVTLTNTAYVGGGVLALSHFTVTDTVAGTVRVSDVTRNSAAVATLTLAYDEVDITTDGMLSVTLAAAGHTGADDLMTNTIAITASAGANVCDRTAQVRDAIVAVSTATECTSVTDLATITTIDLSGQSITALVSGDFDDLTGLTNLDLSGNSLASLNADIFNGLASLAVLNLSGNSFTADIGLPAGIFDDVLDTVTTIGSTGITVDENVRAAHFVCSRDDADAIVAVIATVSDCLRISSSQLATVIPLVTDATLSTLTISEGRLDPAFDTAATTYTVAVDSSVTSVRVTPTATRSAATITVNNVAVTSGNASNDINLPTPGMEVPITIEVTAADTTTMLTYTVTVTRAEPLTAAALTGTLTEANLFAATAPTVTVTLSGTAYEAAPGTLLPSHFSLTDTVAGTVSVSDVTRDSDTVATLTLAYSGEDITTSGTLSVILAAAGHIGTDDLMTNTIAITASAVANVCGRTAQVRDAILADLTLTLNDCANVPLAELQSVRNLNLFRGNIAALESGDFAGLTALQSLSLSDNPLETLPATIFAGLTALQSLNLSDNPLEELPATIFDGLSALQRLSLRDNNLAALPATIFDGLDRLNILRLRGNSFTADTGLPAGIFDDVLDTLGPIGTSGLQIDQTVRDAHFVCSRSDAAAIVLATTGVTDCLRISAAQLNAYLAARGATLAGTLTEANLFAATAPTVTVTLVNTAYAAPGTLTPSHFSVTDTVAGTVSVSDVTRDSDTVATLTLAYSGEDITISGTLSVILAAAGHTGTDDLMTGTIPITASTDTNVCGRTAQVRDEIVRQSSATECMSITDLATISFLSLERRNIASLQPGDFAGLTDLVDLFLQDNALEALPATIFAGLTELRRVQLNNNDLAALPATIFDGLDRLNILRLRGNSFTAGTGLPAGIFDDVLDTLGPIGLGETNVFTIDSTVRAAHFVCSRADAAAIVMATTGVTDCLRISTAQLNAYLAARGATLAGTLTEADLFSSTAPTVTVTLANTAYAVEGTLLPSHFSVTDTVAGTVSVSGFTRDSATVATLTLAYSGEDITTTGTLSVILAAAGHTGTDDLMTSTIPITASTGVNVCGRTAQVRDGIVGRSSATECTSITDLASITSLNLFRQSIASLQPGDFAGLTSLEILFLAENALETLPATIFDGLTALHTLSLPENGLEALPATIFDGLSALQTLDLGNNDLESLPATIFAGLTGLSGLFLERNALETLPATIFAGLTALQRVELNRNALAALPATIFDGLTALETLFMDRNRFTADTGLPAGIFDDVLDTLGPIRTIALPRLQIDQIVRDAHFVCSRADAAAIVMATPGVTDCLRISAAQLNAALEDATLSGLTLSDGTDLFPLAPVFASGITIYTASVPNSVTSVTVTPTATRSGATITVNSAPVTSGNASNAINLPTPGVAVPITIVVTADDGATAETYTVMVTRAPPPPATATLAGTLTEANLFAATAPTVTVTLANTAYAAPGTLMPSDFSVTDTVAGTVSVSDVTRNSDTVATLTLAYSGEDITTTGALSVILAAAGHTGTDDLMTSTIAITASAGTNICGRTAQVRDEIVRVSSATECTSITDLASITRLDLSTESIASLQPGDFAGLTALQRLDLDNNDLEALPANIFDGLPALLILGLGDNDLEALPATIFVGLTALQELDLSANSLSSLDANIFVGLTALQRLDFGDNDLEALPANIFDGLPALLILGLGDNDLEALPATIFVGLTALQELDLSANSLSSLDANIFVGLTALQRLDFGDNDLEALPATIFAGLSALQELDLSANSLSSLDANIFVGLTALQRLDFGDNDLEALPATIFAGLSALEILFLNNNDLEALPATIFDGLERLSGLRLFANPFTADTGLPAGIFDDVLDTLGAIGFSGFAIDQTVRDAHFVCSRADAAAIVMATVGVTDCLRISTAQLNAYLAARGATLAGTLTEASLFATPSPTVTVTLANTEYAVEGTLMPSHFSVTDTVAGTVSVSDVTRNSDTVATLTLAYSGEDITTTGTLSVILAAAGHTGTDDLMTSTIPITASTGTNVCGRTAQVRDGIVSESSATECTSITDLATITRLDLGGQSIASLQPGDFAGLTALQRLDLSANDLSSLDATIFAGLTALQELDLGANRLSSLDATIFAGLTALSTLNVNNNALGALPATIFAGLTALSTLNVNNNALEALPTTIFDGLESLATLRMAANSFTADTGLPVGIFDDVLDTLGPITTNPSANGLVIDQTVRDAHFVCSRDDANAIVAFTAGVENCLRIRTAQLNAYLAARGATLAGTLTEANLFAATAPTVTVTLANTEYAVEGTLMPSHFSVTDTVAGTVRVSDVTRDTDTVATLTLAYSGEDITTAGTLSVILAAAGHTGTDDLMTSTIPITASTGTNVCGRTAQVRDGIVAQSSAGECTSITDLATISGLLLNGRNIASLQPGDFAGLTALLGLDLNSNRLSSLDATIFAGLSALQRLVLNNNDLDALPATIFAGLTALQELDLRFNDLNALPATIFAGLTALQVLELPGNDLEALPATIFDSLTALNFLDLNDNALEALPATIFDGLDSLFTLRMVGNPFTADTGLPAGIFDNVLDTLGAIVPDIATSFTGFVVDQTARDAHFVCSRDDAAVIVTFAGVTDCLLVTSAQFNAYIDATLSGLTLSDGTDLFPLTPVFASGTTTYTVAVPNSVTSVRVTPTATQSAATITVSNVAVPSGSASNAVNLPTSGMEVPITIVVTAADTTTMLTYTVIVTRNASLSLSSSNKGVAEGGSVTVTVALDDAVQGGFTVEVATMEGSAVSADYTIISPVLTFTGTAGEEKTFVVSATDDDIAEGDETFTVSLDNFLGTTVPVFGVPPTTFTIIDNDLSPSLTVTGLTFPEDIGTATLTLNSDKSIVGGFSVEVSTVNGSATAPEDYTAFSQTITFREGETVKTFTVDIQDDSILEEDETFNIDVVNAAPMITLAGLTFITPEATTVTINDDDSTALSITGDLSVNEGENSTITVALDNTVEGGFTVEASAINGSAIADDYTIISPVLTFTGTAGEEKTFVVSATDDDIAEGDETFTVSLDNFLGTTLPVDGVSPTTFTIIDNDLSPSLTVTGVTVVPEDIGTATLTLNSDKSIVGGFSVEDVNSQRLRHRSRRLHGVFADHHICRRRYRQDLHCGHTRQLHFGRKTRLLT